MKLVTSLLLGSAAVVTAAAGAQAADLPSRKAAPVEYVKICDAYGAGFFYIPGTDTCLRIGGRVRFGMVYAQGRNIISAATGLVTQVASDQDTTGMEIRGRIDVDARTQSNWGTVQTVVQLRGTNADGNFATAAGANFATSVGPTANASSTLTMERAYIRFAGITAGVGSSNFSTMPEWTLSSNDYAGFPNGIKELAYTLTFGGGFSATLAIESRGDYGNNTVTGAAQAPSAVPTGANSTYVTQWDTGYNLVGNVRWDQSWGYIQLSGILGNDSATCVAGASVTGQICSSSNNVLNGPTKYGAWAFVPSFGVKLPMIAPGDEFRFQASISHGDYGATSSAGDFNDISNANNRRFLGGVIRSDSNLVPTLVTATGQIAQYGVTDSWGVFGIFQHYWTPTVRSYIAAGTVHFDPPTANCSTLVAGVCTQNAGLNTQWGRGENFMASGTLIWSPVKNFDIGIDLEYLHVHSVLQNPSTAFVAAGQPGLTQDGLITHIRLQRDF